MKVLHLLAGYSIDKVYWAVVENFSRPETEGVLDENVSSESDGKPYNIPATSEFRVLARGGQLSWLEMKPITGRHLHPHSMSHFPKIIWRFQGWPRQPSLIPSPQCIL